jgi:hypothetical protein
MRPSAVSNSKFTRFRTSEFSGWQLVLNHYVSCHTNGNVWKAHFDRSGALDASILNFCIHRSFANRLSARFPTFAPYILSSSFDFFSSTVAIISVQNVKLSAHMAGWSDGCSS